MFITGDVKRPGAYPRIADGNEITVLKLLDKAALIDNPAPHRVAVRVFHRGADGKKLLSKQIPLDALLHPPAGQPAPDLPLHAQDIVMVGAFARATTEPASATGWQDVE